MEENTEAKVARESRRWECMQLTVSHMGSKRRFLPRMSTTRFHE
uniref:Uncharacterized protein n=1 Tax=Arundo donax TaxID=35708 RepID=A0A0A9DPY0_ARUDO